MKYRRLEENVDFEIDVANLDWFANVSFEDAMVPEFILKYVIQVIAAG